MVTIESNTESGQEMADALKASGYTPRETEEQKPAEEAKSVETTTVDDKTTEQSGEPGDKVPAETESKTAAEEKPAETTTQETSQETKTEETEEDHRKAKGGYQAKIEKLTRQLDRTRDELELERGDKTSLRSKVAELESQLATLKPAETKKPDELVKPKRPTRAEFEFDEAKYEAAMDKYDGEVADYHQKMADRTVNQRLAEAEEQRRKDAAQAEADRAFAAYQERLNKDKADIEDWNELFDGVSEAIEIADAAEGAILESDHPGYLVAHLAANRDELTRINKLNPLQQVRAIAALEIKLTSEREKKPVKKEEKQAETKPVSEVKPPEKEKEAAPAKPAAPRAKTPDAPIEPVGGSVAIKNGDSYEKLADTGNQKMFTKKLLSELDKRRGG